MGRIVLDLKPEDKGIDSLPDIGLEDGDRFVVPRIPSNVTVEGQVYSANAFIYAPGKRARSICIRQEDRTGRQITSVFSFCAQMDRS